MAELIAARPFDVTPADDEGGARRRRILASLDLARMAPGGEAPAGPGVLTLEREPGGTWAWPRGEATGDLRGTLVAGAPAAAAAPASRGPSLPSLTSLARSGAGGPGLSRTLADNLEWGGVEGLLFGMEGGAPGTTGPKDTRGLLGEGGKLLGVEWQDVWHALGLGEPSAAAQAATAFQNSPDVGLVAGAAGGPGGSAAGSTAAGVGAAAGVAGLILSLIGTQIGNVDVARAGQAASAAGSAVSAAATTPAAVSAPAAAGTAGALGTGATWSALAAGAGWAFAPAALGFAGFSLAKSIDEAERIESDLANAREVLGVKVPAAREGLTQALTAAAGLDLATAPTDTLLRAIGGLEAARQQFNAVDHAFKQGVTVAGKPIETGLDMAQVRAPLEALDLLQIRMQDALARRGVAPATIPGYRSAEDWAPSVFPAWVTLTDRAAGWEYDPGQYEPGFLAALRAITPGDAEAGLTRLFASEGQRTTLPGFGADVDVERAAGVSPAMRAFLDEATRRRAEWQTRAMQPIWMDPMLATLGVGTG